MKDSNTPAGNAIRNFQIREILLDTKGQNMKESNILAHNATNNFHKRGILPDTKGLYILICNFNTDSQLSLNE